MSNFQRGKGSLRRSFGKIKEVASLPNLIEIQSKSFNDFVQLDFLPAERKKIGLEKVFRDIFPVEHNERISLEYVSYELGEWACVCGHLTGIVNRYKWSCSSCKKSGTSRLADGASCAHCKKKTASYNRCKKCYSRVFIKMPVTVDECRYSGKTYSMPLKVCMQLMSWEIDEATGKKVVRDIKEQDVFFCDLPVMVDLFEESDSSYRLGNQGTFLINGVDRVVVSQIHRSAGVLFSVSKKTKDFRGNPSHIARIIPARGAWLDFEFDTNDLLYARIDKKKKILATTLLQAFGIQKHEILPLFYSFEYITFEDDVFYKKVDARLVGQRIEAGSLPKSIEDKYAVGQRITAAIVEEFKKAGVKELIVRKSSLVNRIASEDIINPVTGELLATQGDAITAEIVDMFSTFEKGKIALIHSSGYAFQPSLAVTLAEDECNTYEDAIKEVYTRLKPGDVPSLKVMEEHLQNLFFNPRFYDLTIVGRIRTNRKLGLDTSEEITHLTKEDVVATLKYLIALKERGEGELDDIDHLGNRCVRLVGELLQSQLYVGFARIEKIVKERFRLQENYASLMPYDFVNVKPLSAVLREFFGTGQLSQFMDQTNPLSEMAHKRRLSALGPGGITRERATLEIRDVHTSHYGRICPIETPEGQNIGLISSLSTYARVNELGFIETTYRPVIDGVVQDNVVYKDAFQEVGENVAQATIEIDRKTNKIKGDKIFVRRDGNIVPVDATDVTLVDASPRQLVSVATAMIPFLEHDDANRALMGSNMQRQAVPLVRPQTPLVGTGIEFEIGSNEGAVIVAKNNGVVEYVSADKIVIRIDTEEKNEGDWFSHPIDIYNLKKFGRSSHNTWIHFQPIVSVGDRVSKGEVLTDGPAVINGELALGQNIIAAFMPWHGYNFEDAIVISKKMVAKDTFTSIHVEEFTVEARDTKLGAEEITRDIPNVSEKELDALDEDGIIKIGSRVSPGDILVGKVTLKGDVQVSPEEKLLRAIFGEKSREVRDTSLRVPPGVEATVIDVKVFSRSGMRKDKRYKDIVAKETEKIEENFVHYMTVLNRRVKDQVIALLAGVESTDKKAEFVEKGKFSADAMALADVKALLEIKAPTKDAQTRIAELKEMLQNEEHVLLALKDEQVSKLRKGDDLPSGVIKMVRVYLAMKRALSVGDKMAGRHGNKGVVSRIVNVEDMPYMEDGRSVDIVLNPLGIPGRMNVGQILETVLGFACKKVGRDLKDQLQEMTDAHVVDFLRKYYGSELVDLIEKKSGKDALYELAHKTAKSGLHVAVPIFDGADFEKEIRPLFKELSLSERGTYTLYHGQTGEAFDQPVTVGCIYMMKLNHLADDKLHARSVGPYSLITQQPLGGKAQFGGQRLGEMEVWALYAYGAAYTLQEMLTIKSDDVNGRVKAYEAIVRGDEIPDPGIPESFNVLVKELQSLGLQVDLFKSSKEQAGE